jgi:hypothetical protein
MQILRDATVFILILIDLIFLLRFKLQREMIMSNYEMLNTIIKILKEIKNLKDE